MSRNATPKCLERLDVLVLAGGRGTRLRAAIGETAKLMAPIAGKPYLAHLFAWLARFGARRVVLSLGYKAETVLEFLERQSFPGLDVVTCVESEPLGTAGAVRFARPLLRSDPVLVMNGDSYCDADLCALIARHRDGGALGTLLCADVEDAGRYGRVVVDSRERVTGFFEKDPSYHGLAAINAGVYVMSGRLLEWIMTSAGDSLERDVIERLVDGSLVAMRGRYRFIDIGTPESFAQAAEVLGGLVETAVAGLATHDR
jgi:NDP-sugar pyrophosphorylase family protein